MCRQILFPTAQIIVGCLASRSLSRARSVFVAVRPSRLSLNRASAIAADSFAKGNLVREGASFDFKRESAVLARLKRKMRSKQKSSSRLLLFFLLRGLQFESLIIIDCCRGGEDLWLACKSLHCHARCYLRCQGMLQFLRLECWTDYPHCQTLRLLCIRDKTWQSHFALPCYGGSDSCSNSDK